MTIAPYSISYYQSLLTSEYNSDQNTLDTIALTVQPYSDTIAFLQNLYQYFQLNSAGGDQLTKLGYWVGASRSVFVPLTGIYFTLDDATLGLDQGILQGPYDPMTGLISLPDDIYLMFIKILIGFNAWDGSISDLYTILNPFFTGLTITDYNNNTMLYALSQAQSAAIVNGMFLEGYFSIAPAGVQLLTPTIA